MNRGLIIFRMQSFAGEELYPSVEEKAAHLLYFIIKNHPFVDGNKRSGACSGLIRCGHSTKPSVDLVAPDSLPD